MAWRPKRCGEKVGPRARAGLRRWVAGHQRSDFDAAMRISNRDGRRTKVLIMRPKKWNRSPQAQGLQKRGVCAPIAPLVGLAVPKPVAREVIGHFPLHRIQCIQRRLPRRAGVKSSGRGERAACVALFDRLVAFDDDKCPYTVRDTVRDTVLGQRLSGP